MYQDDASQQPADPKKLFVGSLPFSMTEDQITELFAQYGELASVKLIIDKMTGRSRGFAFVTFGGENAEKDAEAALQAVNNMEVEGRQLIVTIARPLSPDSRGPRRFDDSRGGGRGGSNGGGFRGGSSGGFRGGDSGGFRRGPSRD